MVCGGEGREGGVEYRTEEQGMLNVEGGGRVLIPDYLFSNTRQNE